MSDDLERIIISLGFESQQEWSRMVAAVDLTSPAKVAAFNAWKEEDGSKDGLRKLPVRNEKATLGKSELMKLVKIGAAREGFTHQDLGRFDVTALRDYIQLLIETKMDLTIHRCLYDLMSMHDMPGVNALDYMMLHREVDQQRCEELTEVELNDPVICLLVKEKDGTQSHMLVDGIHRIVERKRRGKPHFDFYLIPVEHAPRVKEDAREIPWGDKEVVPGVGFVDRKKG